MRRGAWRSERVCVCVCRGMRYGGAARVHSRAVGHAGDVTSISTVCQSLLITRPLPASAVV